MATFDHEIHRLHMFSSLIRNSPEKITNFLTPNSSGLKHYLASGQSDL
ncbi:hypothetical protein ACW18Q_09220 [Limosilactobacillus reuteri]